MKRIVPGVIAAALCCSAYAQEKFEVKVAEFVGAQHFMSKWLVGWGEKLEKASGTVRRTMPSTRSSCRDA